MKNIFKEIGFPFPENAKYIQKEKGLKLRVHNGKVCIEYAKICDIARA